MMENNIVEEVRKFVEAECKKPTAKYGPAYEGHFIPMHKRAVESAEKLGADLEIVGVTAWLHDIGSIIVGRDDHHITGAEIAEKKLKELGYPKEKIEQVKHCILNHRGSVGMNGETVESQIIIEADTLSGFDNLGGLFEAALVYEGLHQKDAVKSVLKKLKRKYNQLSEESRELVQDKYDAALILFGGNGENEN